MAVTIQHGSRTRRFGNDASEASVVWQGTYEEIQAFKATKLIGEKDPDLGTLINIKLTQGTGCIWLLQLDYKEVGLSIEYGDKEKEPVEQQLSAKIISVPIEAHKNYKVCWNHFLIAACYFEGDNYTDKVPAWYTTKTDPYLDPMTNDGKNYKWVKNLSEAPPTTKYVQWGLVKSGNLVCRPTKPGVTSFDKALMVIREVGYHSKKSYAGWATRDMINTIVDKPLLGDFSITQTGYNWKIDDIEVTYTGEQWEASRTYTMSGDSTGWDRDIYP